ncbi:MAG: hypothetical protein JSR98_19080 [Proteobacteria bacterium]|nr:hypothetical protein [Pseudomonadota bacterium]
MTDAQESSRIDEILQKARRLHEQRHELLQTDFNEDDFLNGLMRLLLSSPDIQAAVGAVEGTLQGTEIARPNNAARIKDRDQYFASEFVAWAKKNDPKIFDWVADLGGAAMVAEALIEIRTPSPQQTMRTDLTVCLDGPFAMELLGLSGLAAQQDAKAIVDGLRAQNVGVNILRHSVDEIEANLTAVLGKSPQERTGPTAQAIIHGEAREQDLSEVLLDVPYYLNAISVTVVDPAKLEHLADRRYFSDEEEHSFFASIQGQYQYMIAAERDAASMAWIMRRRKGEEFRDLLKSKFLLVSRNDRLYRTVNKFCRDNGLVKSGCVGPVALVRDIAGILWLVGGSAERETISRRQLLLNCQKARGSSPDIVSSMYSTLKNINNSSAELFWAAVQKPRYLSLTLDAVAFGGGAASPAIAEDVIDRIRDDLVADERAKSKAALQRVKEQHAQDTNLNLVAINSLEKESAALKAENAMHTAAWRKLSVQIWRKYQRDAARKALRDSFGGALIVGALAAAAAVVGSGAVTLSIVPKLLIVVGVAVALLFISVGRIHKWAVQHAEKLYSLRYVAEVEAQVPEREVQGILVRDRLLKLSLRRLFSMALGSHSVPD